MGEKVYSDWNRTARLNADRVAIRVYPGRKAHTFGEIASATEEILDNPALVLRPNRIVVIQMANSADWLKAFLSCQAVGAIALAIEQDVPDDGLDHLISFLRPCALWNSDGIRLYSKSKTYKPACLVKLTSGSTGAPRPLFFEDQQMLADGHNIIATMGIDPRDVNLAAIPFGHSYGLGNLVMPLLMQGTAIAVSSDPFPFSLAGAIQDSQATVFPAVPTLLNGLVRAEIPANSLSSVRLFISAGSPLTSGQAKSFHEKFGMKVRNFYGSSETGGIAYDRTGDDTLSGRAIGDPLENVETRISPSGRLLVSSEAVFRKSNRHTATRGASYLLPDLAMKLPDGSIALLGRTSRLVKLAGKRLNLAEIEKWIVAIEGVENAHVSVLEDRYSRMQLAAALVSSRPIHSVKEQLKRKLPVWKIPSRWVLLEAFPVTSRGKVNYEALEKEIRDQVRRPGEQ
jgi:acyl-coenzyme A synthetase/AMP-(fatty) acid ligase